MVEENDILKVPESILSSMISYQVLYTDAF